MKKTKKIVSIFLALLMVVSIIPMSSITASAENDVYSGMCGANLTWTFYKSTGVLTISGTGAMYDYSSDIPWYNYGVKSIIINNGVTTIGNHAFDSCDITSVTIPDSVTKIGNYAFTLCYSLTGVTIPDSVTTIGDYAFYYCDSLTSVTIPDSVKTIGNGAFYDCTNLKSVTIPDSVKTIGDSAFYHCYDLASVTIGNCAETIGAKAFWYCTSLTSVIIPDSVTTIGDEAFRNCESLTSVTIGDGVKIIGESAFNNCSSLVELNISDISSWCNISFANSLSNPLFYTGVLKLNGMIVINLVIPDETEIINEYAFANYESLTSITIPDSVTTIRYGAFANCDSLKDVYYIGTKEQWSKITKYTYNEPLLNATIHYNSLGEHLHCYLVTVIPPTCTTQGYTLYSCDCGETYTDNYVEAGHSITTVVTPATCTVSGISCEVCEMCGETFGTSIVIPATGHTAGEWETVLEPTYEAYGKKVQKCTVCDEVVAEEVIPMLLKATVTDKETGIIMEYSEDNYNGEVKIVVEKSFDSTVFAVIDTSLNASQRLVYDIIMTVDGVETQPNGSVTIRIPLPEGYDPNRSFVYYVDTVTGLAEKMLTKYENGYLVFETTHFSFYAVVEEYNYTFSIQTPSRTTIRHKDGIKLHANIEGRAPTGLYVVWTASNGNFKTEEINNGNSLNIVSDKNGKTTFTATLYSADGEVLATDSIEMKSKAGFFDKIGSFFRSLFGSTKIYEN